MKDLIDDRAMAALCASEPKATICLDFDGVIHGYQSGWRGAGVIPDAPVPGAIDGILRLIDAGYRVAIYSSRSGNLLGRRAMKRWLAHQMFLHFWRQGRASGSWTVYDVEADYWGDADEIVHHVIAWPWFKPAALLTIDDRAITFDGNWGAITPEMIQAFRPWNKRGRP
jgi:hypothetical protein